MLHRPHGETSVEVIGDVVHTYPVGGFNELGILEYEKAVLAAIPESSSWQLVDHPMHKAGLTPMAMPELNRVFKGFIQLNCLAIAEHVESTFGLALEKFVLHDLKVPTLVSNNESEIEAFLNHTKQSMYIPATTGLIKSTNY